MKYLIYLLIPILFTSCLTARRIERNCDLFAKVCGSGTTTEIRYRDTIIYLDRKVPVFLPHDTAQLHGLVNINSSGAQMNRITSSSGIVTVTAEVVNSKLTATGYINRDSIIAQVRDSIKLKNAIRESDSKTTVTVQEKVIPGFYKFTFWVFIAELVALLLYGFLRLKKSLA